MKYISVTLGKVITCYRKLGLDKMEFQKNELNAL